jgi:hypothetical protein
MTTTQRVTATPTRPWFAALTLCFLAATACLWGLCLVRAGLSWWQMDSLFRAEASVNALNDAVWARNVFWCYAVGGMVGLIFVRRMWRRGSVFYALPLSVNVLCAVWLISIRPEGPVVFIPPLAPLLAPGVNLLLLLVAGIAAGFRRLLILQSSQYEADLP